MTSKVTFKRNGNLAKLVAKLQKLNRQKIEVGYFQSQGIHTSAKLHYTELMRIHEHGVGVYVRPVLGAEKSYNYSDTIVGQMEAGSFKKLLKGWLCDYVKNANFTNDHLADKFGMWAVHSANEIFGNPDVLWVTTNETPLIDTSELADNFAWKVSWRGTVHTL